MIEVIAWVGWLLALALLALVGFLVFLLDRLKIERDDLYLSLAREQSRPRVPFRLYRAKELEKFKIPPERWNETTEAGDKGAA